MPLIPRKTACFLAFPALSLGLVFSTGCSDSGPQSGPEAVDSAEPTSTTYVVRGVISTLPYPDNPASSLNVKHEAIPDFVDAQGKTVGMDTMTMPFPVADDLDLSSFSVDDKVEVTFVVTWGGEDQGWTATQLSPLPEDAELDFTPLAKPHDHHGHDHHGHGDHSGHNH
ncbi:copper-binding protein [Algisphaera agarilytica]|uniref:Cu/Ag efflux protein CusF n=1 Tax=Algisphaera agarilytica TaxID=1385975 RepID=A0A7X0HAC8_9BACT|nr:copper-binding protein [Algisphaera agarilytica]MBB6430719.1 Cu/Ag efflux protein CusF [Algisphaera agarilytica]